MRGLTLGILLTALFLGIAALSFLWTPYNIETFDIPNKLQTPSGTNWLGTDQFGRDILSMIMMGARTSIAVALLAVGIGLAVGIPLGLWAAARRGSLIDELIMRGNDLIFAFPSLVIAILITAIFGARRSQRDHRHRHLQHPGLRPPHPRCAALPLWQRDFILAARVSQANPALPHFRGNTSCPTLPTS